MPFGIAEARVAVNVRCSRSGRSMLEVVLSDEATMIGRANQCATTTREAVRRDRRSGGWHSLVVGADEDTARRPIPIVSLWWRHA
jgi:hypothetical protein